jgi:hypothetical protein
VSVIHDENGPVYLEQVHATGVLARILETLQAGYDVVQAHAGCGASRYGCQRVRNLEFGGSAERTWNARRPYNPPLRLSSPEFNPTGVQDVGCASSLNM